MNKYNIDLEKCQANHQALTPIRFLQRSADVFPNRTAVIYKDRKYTWKEYAERCHKLARALISSGVQRGRRWPSWRPMCRQWSKPTSGFR